VNPVIRVASTEDIPALTRIHRGSFEQPWDEQAFRGLMEGPGAFVLVGRNAAATDLQSFVLIQIAADESEIFSIATVPAARRSGLARALVLEAAAQAALRQANVMFLEVAQDNEAALALYRGCGFAVHGCRQAYYIRNGGQPVDALLLRARLPVETAMGMARRLD
jgi:ribosomal-protein-alanine N-acetyltransferase